MWEMPFTMMCVTAPINCSQSEKLETQVFIPHCHVFIQLSIKIAPKTGSGDTFPSLVATQSQDDLQLLDLGLLFL